MSKEIKKVGMALQGGGSHGAFTWGVLDRLIEEDALVADAMCGTSAGAINAVVCAYGLQLTHGRSAKSERIIGAIVETDREQRKFFSEAGLNGQIFRKRRYL
jgi:predicted acylesterase/phospholipase RssA